MSGASLESASTRHRSYFLGPLQGGAPASTGPDMTVTDAEVKAIYETSKNTNPFIQTAEVVCGVLQGKGLSESLIHEITLYVAVHFTSISQERAGLVRDDMGQAEQEYQRIDVTGGGLSTTIWGQQAMMLDTSGELAKLGGKALRALFEVV